MKKAIRLNTLVRLQSEYRRHYEMGYKPEAAITHALRILNLPLDFKRDDHQMITDNQDPKTFDLVECGY
jgi:hypothetical protein